MKNRRGSRTSHGFASLSLDGWRDRSGCRRGGRTTPPEAAGSQECPATRQILEDESTLAIFRGPNGNLSRAMSRLEAEQQSDWQTSVAAAESTLATLAPDTLRRMSADDLALVENLRARVENVSKTEPSSLTRLGAVALPKATSVAQYLAMDGLDNSPLRLRSAIVATLEKRTALSAETIAEHAEWIESYVLVELYRMAAEDRFRGADPAFSIDASDGEPYPRTRRTHWTHPGAALALDPTDSNMSALACFVISVRMVK